jgi:hypothetical protein
MPEFGEIRRVELREMWPNEAGDFTPWLAANIETLGKALGLELELAEREASVGDFSCDLLATDLGTGRAVVIENQLTPTNHDHLGKLLTYAAGLEAGVIVWVAQELRDEHRQALEWLNSRTDTNTDFFGVVVEVFRIDESRPALNFKLVAFPNEWQKEGRQTLVRSSSSRGEQYRQFFQVLIDALREQHQFTNARAGQPQNWYTFPTGITGLRYGFNFPEGDRVRTELYIDREDGPKNKALFDSLLGERQNIEQAFGQSLEWERLDDRRASRIATYRPGSIDQDSEQLEQIRNWAIEQLLKFKEVFGHRLRGHLERVVRANAAQPPAAADAPQAARP